MLNGANKLDFKEIEEYCICPYCNTDIEEYCEDEDNIEETLDDHMEWNYFIGYVRYWKEIFICPNCSKKILLDCSW